MPRIWNADLSTGDFSQPGGTETGGTFDGTPPLKDTIQVSTTIDGFKPPPGQKYMCKITVHESDGSYGTSTGRRALTRQYDDSEWARNLRYPGYDSSFILPILLPADYPSLGGNMWVAPMELHHTSGIWVAPSHGTHDGTSFRYDVRGGDEGNVSGNIHSVQEAFPYAQKKIWHYWAFRYLHDPVNGAIEVLHAQEGDTDFKSLIKRSGIPTMYRGRQSYMLFGLYSAIIQGLSISIYMSGMQEWDTIGEVVNYGKSMLNGVAPPDPGPVPNPTPTPVKATSNIQSNDVAAPGEPWTVTVHHDAQKCEYMFDGKLLGTDTMADEAPGTGDDIYEIPVPDVADGDHTLGFTVFGANNTILYKVGPFPIKTKKPPVQINVPGAITDLQGSLTEYFVGWSGNKKHYTEAQAKKTRVYKAVEKLGGKWPL